MQLCNYPEATEQTLQRDLFLLGLDNETFMSRIISAQIWQKLKKLESGKAIVKYIKQGSSTHRSTQVNQIQKKNKKFKKGQQ